MKQAKELTISVRDLVEFVLRTGDLGGERDFVSASRAWEGTRGHQRVQKSRPEGYETEVAVSHRVEIGDLALVVKGRIDGVLRTSQAVILEEIKTVQGAWNGEADPLHWAQARIYAAIYALQQGLEKIDIQLTYLDLGSDSQKTFRETFDRSALAGFLAEVVTAYLQWARQQRDWRHSRDQSIQSLAFPFPAYRPGQRGLAVAVYRAISRREKLFVEAPTGIGKTISVLFPAIKAQAEGYCEKIFYLTAKTVGRAVAAQTLEDMRKAGLRLRFAALTAKEKICFNEDGACEAGTCPYAIGYYDRNKPAVEEALSREALTRSVIEEVARRHQVCPHELSLDASLWVDVIICDYNYVFDPRVYLRRFFDGVEGDYVFLVDEAHNLVDRAREMFSAELDKAALSDMKRAVKDPLPGCAKILGKVNRCWLGLLKAASPLEVDDSVLTLGLTAEAAGTLCDSGNDTQSNSSLPLALVVDKSADPPKPLNWPVERAREGGLIAREIPRDILALLRQFLREAERWLVQNRPSEFRDALLELYFCVNGFLRIADLFDARYRVILDGHGRSVRIRLFCLDPSFLLNKALKRGISAVFFSATLTPLEYFRELLGGDPQDKLVRQTSPFPIDNLCVMVQDQIPTHLKAREASFDRVVEAIRTLVSARQGNYLVYFPSYQYLNQVWERFGGDRHNFRFLIQTPGMAEEQRESFLAEFHTCHKETLVGFAVMGGLFGEGIDLAGDRLVGAVVVGVGLPRICLERDLIRDYFQEKAGAGFDYAYRFPGMNRVLQAAGRVIRSETDRGVVLLIDTRFAEERYRCLFPAHWRPRAVRGEPEIAERANAFWTPNTPSALKS